jgi:hypothetical protein
MRSLCEFNPMRSSNSSRAADPDTRPTEAAAPQCTGTTEAGAGATEREAYMAFRAAVHASETMFPQSLQAVTASSSLKMLVPLYPSCVHNLAPGASANSCDLQSSGDPACANAS